MDVGPDNGTIFGGKGDDSIDVREGLGADEVDCGPGKDMVTFDPNDEIENCERLNPEV